MTYWMRGRNWMGSQKMRLAAVVDGRSGAPVQGVLRRRSEDLVQWIFEAFRVMLCEQSVSRILTELGAARLSALALYESSKYPAID